MANDGSERIIRLLPADTPRYMAPAWAGCMMWAIGKAEILEAFRLDTGRVWRPAASPLERAIDTATGAELDFIEAFIRWANVKVWGKVSELPADWQREAGGDAPPR